MKNHIKVYMEYFGYGMEDFIPSEISGDRAVDIHHIDCRGMGSSKEKDNINNLMALTRAEHTKYGDKKQWMMFLKLKHEQFMKNHGR
jgi:hypothetical protein